jgi:bacteriocin-like protein
MSPGTWSSGDWDGPFAGLMETTMSKTKDTEKTRELTEAELNHVSGGKPSAAKSSPAPKISESLSLSYEEVKFEYTEQH